MFNMPFLGAEAANLSRDPKKGQSIKQDWEPEGHGFWQETSFDEEDKHREIVCAACGKPGGLELKMCSRCQKIL
jgi:hypothetical protein